MQRGGGEAAQDASPLPIPETPSPPAAPPTVASCPYCGLALEPPPSRSRRCPRCRNPIVVRRLEGRLVLLTEAAVAVFEAERSREVDERTWTADRRLWLDLAERVGAPADRRARLGSAAPAADVVAAARRLYLTHAERAAKAARREKRWSEVAQVRHDQAVALHRESGSPTPPLPEVLALHREWSAARLRSMPSSARDVELVGGSCCPACRADDGRAFRIAEELRGARLPHDGCPRGLCPCDWWPLLRTVKGRRGRRPRAQLPPPAG